MKIKFNTDDDIPLNKVLKFLSATVVIRNIFEKNDVYYPQYFFFLMNYCTTYKNATV